MKTIKAIEMECGQAYVAELGKGEFLEMGDVFLPNENEAGTRPYRFRDFGNVSDMHKRVLTICSMLGCSMGCKFCAVRRSFKRNLTAGELVGQIDYLLEQGKAYGRSTDPLESKEFHVLYTRMGEPCLNIENVLGSIYELADRYPHVKIGMSTIGWRQGVEKFLDHPEIAKHIMMQFSAHGTDEETRAALFDMKNIGAIMSLPEMGKWVKEFRKLNPRKVSLNVILFEGRQYDFRKLKDYFGMEDIYIRLSPLNMTENAEQQGFRGLLREEDVLYKEALSSQSLQGILENLDETGFSYAYAPAIDEEIRHKAACGQALETLKEAKLATFG